MEWTIEAIVAVITGLILIIAAFFAWRQLRAMRLARSAQIAMQLVHDLASANAKKKLSLIYKMWPSEVQRLEAGSDWGCQIEEIIDRFEMLSVFVDKRIIDKDIAIKEWQDPAIRCWWRLYDNYIKRQQDDRGGRYAKHLQRFVARCLEYQVDNVLESERTKYKGEKLVEALLESDDFQNIKLASWVRRMWRNRRYWRIWRVGII